MKKLLPVLLLFLIGCHKAPTILPTEVSTWHTTGLDVSWDQSGSNRIAYSIKEADGYYDIHPDNPENTAHLF